MNITGHANSSQVGTSISTEGKTVDLLEDFVNVHKEATQEVGHFKKDGDGNCEQETLVPNSLTHPIHEYYGQSLSSPFHFTQGHSVALFLLSTRQVCPTCPSL
jgi:hypothetical protein